MKVVILFATVLSAAFVRSDTFEIWQDHADALYRVGEEAQIRVTVLREDGTIRREGKAVWSLDNFGSRKIADGEQDLACANPFFVRGRLDHPDFLRLKVSVGKDARIWSVGYDVEKLRQAKERPADFDAYWAGEKARLAKIPLDPRCERLDWLCREGWDVFRISFATFNDRRVYGFMSVPKNAALRPMRCRVRICDAGPGAVGPWEANDGEVTVTMNVHYFEPPRESKAMVAKIKETDAALSEKYGLKSTYRNLGIGVSREDYYFHDAMLGIARAFDWLAERPFVDKDRLVYFGSSQGGGFGLATTYLNPRFSRVVFCVPAITGHYGTPTGSLPGWPTLVATQKPAERASAERFAAYFDGVNFAAGITTPVRFIVGFSDTCCPPPDVYSAYNVCPAQDKAILNAIGGTHCGPLGALGWLAARKHLNPQYDVNGWLRAADRKRTRVQLWFDTEDYTNPSAWDNVREIAKIMTAEGVKGNFNVVPYLAKVLVDNRRFDVIDALKKHVIGTQTLYHSWHPNVTEIGDGEDYAAAYLRTMRDEAEGWGMLRAAFGLDRLAFTCYPGCGSSYVAFDVHADLGATFHGGSGAFGRSLKSGDRIWYQNLRHIDYNGTMSLQDLGLTRDLTDEQVSAALDAAAKKDAVVFYAHPCMASCKQFWDGLNMRKGNWVEFGHWIPADRRPQAQTARFYARFAAFVRRVKEDPRFEITDCEKLAADCKPRWPITLAEIPAIRASLLKRFGHIDNPASWSVADAFQAAVRLLRGEKAYCPGKVYGFLRAPRGVTAPVVVKAEDLRAAAAKVSLVRHLDASYDVGGVTIGPADFLFAALEVLETGAAEVTVRPRDQLGDIATECAPLASFTHRGQWIFTPEMRDEYLADRLRWQFWTLRYE